MRTLARALGVLLAAALATAALGVLLASLALDAVLAPGATAARVTETGAFERLEREVVPAAVDEVLAERVPQLPTGVGHEASALAADVLPARWLAARAEPVLEGGMDYAMGRSSELAPVELALRDRVAAAGAALAERWVASATATRLWEAALERIVARVEGTELRLPLGLTVEPATLRAALALALERRWFVVTTGSWIAPATAWLTGEADTLALQVPLHERQAEVAAALRLLVSRSDIAGFAEHQLLSPAVLDRVEAQLELPQGVVLERETLAEALRSVITREWLREREVDITATVAAYLAGRSERLELFVPLAALKGRAAAYLSAMVDRRLAQSYDALPQCSRRKLQAALEGELATLKCRPPGVGYGVVKLLLGFDTTAVIHARLDAALPDVWLYDEARARARVGERGWAVVERLRGVMREGLVLTEVDLRALVCPEATDTAPCMLDRAREQVRDGIRLDGATLEAALHERAPEAADGLALARSVLASVRAWRPALAALVVLALLAAALCMPPLLELRLAVFGLVLALAAAALLVALAILDPAGLLAGAAPPPPEGALAPLHAIGLEAGGALVQALVDWVQLAAATLVALGATGAAFAMLRPIAQRRFT